MNPVSSGSRRSWWQGMLETPSGLPSTLSRYTFWNGILYLALGAYLIWRREHKAL